MKDLIKGFIYINGEKIAELTSIKINVQRENENYGNERPSNKSNR